MSKKTKADLMADLASAGDRRDWDGADAAEAELEKMATDPAPAGDSVAAREPTDEERAVAKRMAELEADPNSPAPNQALVGELGNVGVGELGRPRPPSLVGRPCLYRQGEEVMAATICFDHGDGVVNLRVFPNGHNVPLVTSVSYGYDSGQWSYVD